MSTAAHIFLLAISIPPLAILIWFIRKGKLRAKYAMIWIPVMGLMGVMVAAPGAPDRIAHALGVDYPPALFFAAAIVLLISVCIHYAWELSRLEERVRILAEEAAIASVQRPAENRETERVV